MQNAENMTTEALGNDCLTELGDLIFKDEEEPLSPIGILLFFLGLGFVIAAISYFSADYPENGMLFGAVSVLFGLMLSVWSYFNATTGDRKLLLYENAIVQKTKGKTKTLRLEELDKFQCERTPVVYEEMHIGDMFEMTFEAKPDSSQDKIVYSIGKCPAHFDRLLDFVSEKMAQDLAADLSENGVVQWVDTVSIARDGINAPVDCMTTGSQRFIPWSEIRDFDIVQGQMTIKLVNSKWSVVKFDSNAPNFYPGCFLFRQLLGLNKGEPLLEA